MAEFVASPTVSAGPDPAAFDNSQQNSLAALGAQQSLADRATFRQNALGLLNRDPNATAAALGANPQASLGYLGTVPALDQNTRAQATSDQDAAGSLAGAVLNQPAAQRPAAYALGRQALINAGHQTVPGPDYQADAGGDSGMLALRAMSLPVPTQLAESPQMPSAYPVPGLAYVPGNLLGGLGGQPGGQAAAAGGGITATPLPAPGGQGPSASYASNMMGVESGGNATAKNPNSSATGAGQFIDSTWLGLLPQVRPDLAQGKTPQQILALRNDPVVSAQMVNAYAQQNAPKLAAAGVAVNDTTLALAHRFGPDVAAQVASAPPGTPIASIVGPGVMAVNRDLQGQTTGSIAGFYSRRVGGGASALTQTASAANTAGMPRTANDASPGVPPAPPAPGTAPAGQPSAPAPVPPPPGNALNSGNAAPAALPASTATTQPARPVLPVNPHSGALPSGYDDPSMLVKADTPEAAAGLPFNTRFQLPDGTVRTAGVTNHLPPPSQGARPAGYGANGDPAFTPAAPANLNPLLAGVGGRTDGGGSATLPLPPAIAPATPPQAAVPQTPAQGVQPQQLGQPQPLSAPPAPVQPPPPQQVQRNALSALGVGAPIAPNPLAAAGQPTTPQPPPTSFQPQPGTNGAPAVAQTNYPFVRDPKTFIPQAIPGQPGYAMAQRPDGSQVAQRIPGAPGKGVTNKIEGGVALSLDNDDGHLVSRIEGAAPDTSRSTTIAGPDGNIIVQSGQVRGVVPFSTQPAQIAAYTRDADVVSKVAQTTGQAEQQLQLALEGRNLTKGLPSGAGGEWRSGVANYLKTYAPDAVYQAAVSGNFVPDAAQSQEAMKILQKQAVTDEQAMGGSGGLGLTQRYEKTNPSLNMTPQAIQELSNLKAISAQAVHDYGTGMTEYFNKQQTNLLHPDPSTPGASSYQPISNYDQYWYGQRNVGTYLGAAGAINGKPYAEWSKGLQPEDQARALEIISRVDPTTVVNGPNGPIGVVKGSGGQSQGQRAPAAPAVGTVMQGYRFNGGDPSNSASWAKVQ